VLRETPLLADLLLRRLSLLLDLDLDRDLDDEELRAILLHTQIKDKIPLPYSFFTKTY